MLAISNGKRTATKARILVVDNDAQIRRLMRTTLTAQGFEVNEAPSGDEALERVRAEKYDLIILDVNMPGISGIETCSAIRASSDVSIIMPTVQHSWKKTRPKPLKLARTTM